MFDFNNNVLNITVLVEIELSPNGNLETPTYSGISDTVLKFSNRHCIISDEFYEGRILNDIVVEEKLQSLDRPISQLSTVQIEFSNIKSNGTGNGYFDDLLNVFNFYNKTVTIWCGAGTNKTNHFEQVFKGVIRFPDGVLHYDREKFVIEITDIRSRDEVTLPKRKFDRIQYPNIEGKSHGKYIPIVYGDWGDIIDVGDLQYPRIPAICIDTTTNKFKIADHPIKSLDGIYRKGDLLVAALDYNASDINLDEATFILNDYDEDNDDISVDCRGICFLDNKILSVIETPPDIISDLLIRRAGLDTSVVDNVSLSTNQAFIQDNFNDGDYTGWTVGSGTWNANSFYLENTVAGEIYQANTNFDDIRMSFRLKTGTSVGTTVLVGLLNLNTFTGANGYALGFGLYSIYVRRYDSGVLTTLGIITDGTIDFNVDSPTIALVRSNTGQLKVFLNGTLRFTITDTTYLTCTNVVMNMSPTSGNPWVDDFVLYNYTSLSSLNMYNIYKCRKYISEEINLFDLIGELCFETGLIIDINNGIYSALTFYPDFTWKLLDPKLFTYSDVIKDSFSAEEDSDRLYSNQITARYSYHPASVEQSEDNKYLRALTNSDQSAINATASTQELTFNYSWIYVDDNISEIVNNYLRFFGSSSPIDVITATFGYKGLVLKLNEIIRLTYAKYNERECKIVGYRKNLCKGLTEVILYAYPDIKHSGLLTDDFQITYALSDDGGAFTDETVDAKDIGLDDVTLLPAVPVVNDAFYVGYTTQKFGGVYFDISTAGVGTWGITWEYYNGTSWGALSNVTDNTTGFTVQGVNIITYDVPTDWAQVAVNGLTAYWIRGRVSSYTAITTQPLGAMIYLPMLFPDYLGSKQMDSWDSTWTNDMQNYARSKACFSCDESGYLIKGDEDSKDLWGYS